MLQANKRDLISVEISGAIRMESNSLDLTCTEDDHVCLLSLVLVLVMEEVGLREIAGEVLWVVIRLPWIQADLLHNVREAPSELGGVHADVLG